MRAVAATRRKVKIFERRSHPLKSTPILERSDKIWVEMRPLLRGGGCWAAQMGGTIELNWVRDTPISLRRLTVVIPQHAAEVLPSLDITNLLSNFVARVNDPVPQSLVVALPVVVGDELIQCTLQ